MCGSHPLQSVLARSISGAGRIANEDQDMDISGSMWYDRTRLQKADERVTDYGNRNAGIGAAGR